MKNLRSILSFTLLGTTLSIGDLARADSSADGLRKQEAHEQLLRTQTQQIGQQIDSIISEFDRNGLGNGQDVKTLHAMRGVLGQLSDEQMQKVIALLQQARGASDGGLNDEKQAFIAQQGILGQFRDLLTQFEKEQSLDALADRFDHLAKQQSANLRSAVDLAQGSIGKKLAQMDQVSVAALQTQQSEQTGIAGEVKDALAVGKSLLDSATGTDADQLSKALGEAQTSHLSTTTLAAASDLQTGDLYRAASGEKSARDTLRQLADMLAPPKDSLEMKKDQLSKLQAELEKQKEIAEQAKAKPPNKGAAEALRQVDRSQAANVDDTDESRKKLQNLSPAVAQALKEAEAKMQQARADAAQHRAGRTGEDATAAEDKLQQAKNALETEIAKNEADAANTDKTATASDDKLAQTKQLLDQVKQLRDQQKDLTANVPATQPAAKLAAQLAAAPADQQKSLAAKAQELQQQAATNTPAAASQLGEAAQQMQKASDSIAKADQASTQTQQKAAVAALAKAQDGLQQQANALQKAQDQLNQLATTQQQIGDLIKQQAAVALATAQQAQQPTTQPTAPQTATAATQPAAAPPATPAAQQAAAATATQQAQVAQQTAATQSQIPAPAQQAAAALSDAHQQMQQATQQLQKNNAQQAQPAQGQAMTDLGKAAVTVATAMDQLKAQLGQPTGDPAAAQAAVDALKQASQQLQTAQGQLDQAQSGQPSTAQDAQKSLAAAAQAAAQAMGKSDSQAANGALQQAIAQMSQAGGQAKRGQPGPAQQSTAAAQAALAQAQAAMASAAGQTPDQSASATPSPDGQTPAPHASTDGADPEKAGDHAVQDGGARTGTAGATAFVQLPARDRQALQQSQAEKYPEEYGSMVEQYLRNLSDTQAK